MNKAWIYVILTCLFELFWVYGFNVASTWWHWGLIVTIILIDFHFLAKACESLPTGTVYAIFAAAGTVGTALMDVYLFNGALNLAKVFFIGLLVLGVITLKLADNQPTENEEKGVA
ncbi:multidrug resistance protein SMR [Alkalihalobacillus alcalophilus ATCC 27647 = CGMCC 1.3604]|uniref:Ligand-binding protein SH3 n=2 Tax=Alkalihalobacillus alcalophilus ATCC 27647 = CGMCC 1.3604 TaxID=1218173 RepID=A0A094WMB1_ALKAL|nr:SMR family transporter [Alkalihalobacillus alcalophilus]KGA98001.1 ligand-binding protein SH3 [Alkalihalobacillus alcalophilus ATCC 27647 = CGMCC 1.3604]MED1561877.1 SMR family transporter [Alkalihalobacillus alcalophilus]THG90450.1 multidrug resistance protein SMR [Alkalihalobacillus alcalophilus ATCC 27647 = CGMCC 1.3604]